MENKASGGSWDGGITLPGQRFLSIQIFLPQFSNIFIDLHPPPPRRNTREPLWRREIVLHTVDRTRIPKTKGWIWITIPLMIASFWWKTTAAVEFRFNADKNSRQIIFRQEKSAKTNYLQTKCNFPLKYSKGLNNEPRWALSARSNGIRHFPTLRWSRGRVQTDKKHVIITTSAFCPNKILQMFF